MRALVLYHSLFGNTRKVAESLADGIRSCGIETDCKGIDQVNLEGLVQFDLLAIGGPTHMLGLSKDMKAFLDGLKATDLHGKYAFCFDTRNETGMNKASYFVLENSAARRIEGMVKRMKMQIIRPRKSALVNKREGPLYPNVEEQFVMIGKEIGNLLTTQQKSASV
ncbi:MAG: flavodoxin family protein [Candidatus Thorarchaeota archaeon]